MNFLRYLFGGNGGISSVDQQCRLFEKEVILLGNEKLKAFKSEQNAFTRCEIDKYFFLRSEISIVLDGDENGRLL